MILNPIVSLFKVEDKLIIALLYIGVIVSIVLIFIIIGVLIRTRFGRFIDDEFEEKIIKKIPGYSIIKDTIKQFFGGGNSFFSEVVLIKPFNTETYMTGFVTDKCLIEYGSAIAEDIEGDIQYYTVFVPTGPNPTSGNIYHVKSTDLIKVNISVEEAMKTIISCGSGSNKLVKQLKNK